MFKRKKSPEITPEITPEQVSDFLDCLERATAGFIEATKAYEASAARAAKVFQELSKALDRAEKVPPRTAARRSGW